MLRSALISNTSLLAHATVTGRNAQAGGLRSVEVPTGAIGEQDAEVVMELLDAILRLPDADASTATFVGAYAEITRPVPMILGAIKGLESWTRKHRGQPLGDQLVSQIRGLAALGRQELTRPPSAFENRRDEADMFVRYGRIRRLAIQTLQNLSDKETDTIIAAAGDGDLQVRRKPMRPRPRFSNR